MFSFHKKKRADLSAKVRLPLSLSRNTFRGRRSSGSWLYGVPSYNVAGDLTLFEQPGSMTFYEVEPETVTQWTGLSDRHGRMIWDGDLVYYCDQNHDEEDGVGLVQWDVDTARYVMEFPGLQLDFETCCPSYYEVVGNRWDNPELMEGMEL